MEDIIHSWLMTPAHPAVSAGIMAVSDVTKNRRSTGQAIKGSILCGHTENPRAQTPNEFMYSLYYVSTD